MRCSTVAYLGPPQTSKMESFEKVINAWTPWTIVAKLSILDMCSVLNTPMHSLFLKCVYKVEIFLYLQNLTSSFSVYIDSLLSFVLYSQHSVSRLYKKIICPRLSSESLQTQPSNISLSAMIVLQGCKTECNLHFFGNILYNYILVALFANQ